MVRILIAIALALASTCVAAQDLANVMLQRVATAMGANDLKTLKYTAEGTGYTLPPIGL